MCARLEKAKFVCVVTDCRGRVLLCWHRRGFACIVVDVCWTLALVGPFNMNGSWLVAGICLHCAWSTVVCCLFLHCCSLGSILLSCCAPAQHGTYLSFWPRPGPVGGQLEGQPKPTSNALEGGRGGTVTLCACTVTLCDAQGMLQALQAPRRQGATHLPVMCVYLAGAGLAGAGKVLLVSAYRTWCSKMVWCVLEGLRHGMSYGCC